MVIFLRTNEIKTHSISGLKTVATLSLKARSQQSRLMLALHHAPIPLRSPKGDSQASKRNVISLLFAEFRGATA
jgi:hypothetical protein